MHAKNSKGFIHHFHRDEVLEAGQEVAFLSKRLATIALDAPVACAPAALRYQGAEAAAVTALFAELGFQRLSQRIAHWQS